MAKLLPLVMCPYALILFAPKSRWKHLWQQTFKRSFVPSYISLHNQRIEANSVDTDEAAHYEPLCLNYTVSEVNYIVSEVNYIVIEVNYRYFHFWCFNPYSAKQK